MVGFTVSRRQFNGKVTVSKRQSNGRVYSIYNAIDLSGRVYSVRVKVL